jgi:hypothetical protein
MQIIGHPCQKAIGQFRGRNYEVWFTSSINVSEGLWKFTGLPRLILKVVETRGHFIFECKSIEEINSEILLPVEKGEKVSKAQFFALNKLFMEDPLPFLVVEKVVAVSLWITRQLTYQNAHTTQWNLLKNNSLDD